MHACEPTSDVVQAIALDAGGVTLGHGSRLVRFDPRTDTLGLDIDREQCLALLAISTRTPIDPSTILHLEAAAGYWERGDKALANLRLVFAGLPKLRDPADAARLRAAEYLLDQEMPPRELLRELDIDATALGLVKYDSDQPRVPAGQGKESGRWTDGLWDRVGHWLDEEVPVYDQDTGDEVGTQSRGRAIATNPLTIIAAGAAALAAAEAAAAAAAEAAAAAAAEFAPENLTAFALRYLTTSGGRLGSAATRQQLFEIARDFVKSLDFDTFLGDGEGPEEYIAGEGPGTKGSTYVDFTAKRADGSAVRIQTVDTLADGVTPTQRELDAAARIRAKFPTDELRLILKVPW